MTTRPSISAAPVPGIARGPAPGIARGPVPGIARGPVPGIARGIVRGLATGALIIAATGLVGGCSKKARPQLDIAASKITTIGVNAYLWRATLETLSFMPLVQTDSNGGVVVTDWYTNPRNPGERMKVTVSILDQDLRADALRIAASRQIAQGSNWIDAPVQAATVQKLEDIILTKARDLRRQTVRG